MMMMMMMMMMSKGKAKDDPGMGRFHNNIACGL